MWDKLTAFPGFASTAPTGILHQLIRRTIVGSPPRQPAIFACPPTEWSSGPCQGRRAEPGESNSARISWRTWWAMFAMRGFRFW